MDSAPLQQADPQNNPLFFIKHSLLPSQESPGNSGLSEGFYKVFANGIFAFSDNRIGFMLAWVLYHSALLNKMIIDFNTPFQGLWQCQVSAGKKNPADGFYLPACQPGCQASGHLTKAQFSKHPLGNEHMAGEGDHISWPHLCLHALIQNSEQSLHGYTLYIHLHKPRAW